MSPFILISIKLRLFSVMDDSSPLAGQLERLIVAFNHVADFVDEMTDRAVRGSNHDVHWEHVDRPLGQTCAVGNGRVEPNSRHMMYIVTLAVPL